MLKYACQGLHDLRIVENVLDSLETRCDVKRFFEFIPRRERANILYFEASFNTEFRRSLPCFLEIRSIPADPEGAITQTRTINGKPTVPASDVNERCGRRWKV
jgi:hypothetical protein